MGDFFKDFMIEIGFAVDANSQAKAEKAQAVFEERVTASDRRTTKARLREELIRNTATADTFDKRIKSAEKLEQIDSKFGGLALRRTLRQAVAQAKTDEERIHYLDKLNKAQEEHHQRTMSGLNRVAGVALTVAATIQAATVALATYATTVAAKLEAMAYAADRTGSTVSSLKTFSHAVSQLGGSAGGALNDLENFAGKLRSNPQGYTAFLKSVGVEARDAQGNIRGAAELYKEFRKNVGARKPYEQQLLYANEMGVSEQTWRATDPAKLAAEEAAQQAKYARLGYDPNKAAEDAKQLQHALRDMFDSINIIGEKTASKIFKDVGDNLRGFTTFIEQHGDQIAEILSKIAQVVLAVSKAMLELLTSPEVKRGFDWLLGMFGHVEEGTGKWIADTERIKTALEGLAVFVATIFVAKITGAFAAILKELGPLLVRLAPLLGLGVLAYGANSNGILTGPEGSRSFGESVLRTLEPGAADRVFGKTEGDKAADAKDGRTLWQRMAPKALGGKDAPVVNPGNVGRGATSAEGRENVASWLSFFQRPKDQGGMGLPLGKAQAMVAMMQGESGANLNPRAYNPDDNGGPSGGTAQWHDGRDSKRFSGLKAFADKMNKPWTDREAQQQYWKHEAETTHRRAFERIERAGSDEAALGQGVGGFEVPADIPGEIRKRMANLNRLRRDQQSSQPVMPKLQDAARAFSERAAEGASRLDPGKLKAIGAATEGFRPEDYFKTAPPVGTSTNNDNSVRQQSYNRGDSTVNIYTQADARETHDLWRRHEDRQKADDLRHASNVFAA